MLSDHQIYDAIEKGKNHEVLDELYREVFPSILKYIRSKNGRRQQAEDCFQDAVVALIMAIRNGKYKKEHSMESYLFAIARNRWFTQLRTKLIHETPLDEGHFNIQEATKYMDKEKKEVIQQALTAIGDQCKRLLQLVVFEKKRLDEVATIMEFSSSEVAKTYNYRCKKKLKELIRSNPELTSVLRD